MNSWITFWTINVSFSVSRQHLSSPKWSNQISVLEISGDTIYNTFNLEQLEMGQKTQILKLWCGNFPQYYLKCLLRFQTLSSPETGLPLRLFQQGSFQSKIGCCLVIGSHGDHQVCWFVEGNIIWINYTFTFETSCKYKVRVVAFKRS